MKNEASIALGRVTGEYKYQKLAPNVSHVRPVKWLKTIPRSAFPQDILFSLGSTLTVFQVTRNDAAARVEQILGGGEPAASPSAGATVVATAADDAPYDLAETARDQILKFIEQKFKKHDLARLVDAILRAQGYRTHVSPPGPDGGVDILAGRGALGFDHPRLSVQVKSGTGQEGQKTFNELMGVVSKFESEQGLFVSWSGFTNAVKADARKAYFKIRLWDQGQLIDSLLEVYEHLDADIKAELPLKRVWVIAGEDTDAGE